MFQLHHKVALITGATGNLGVATARLFADAGARLGLFGRSAASLERKYPDWVDSSAHFFLAPVDLRDEASVQMAIEQALQHFGRIDILVNAAGGYRGGELIEDTSLQTWQAMMELNALSVFLTCRGVVPAMRAQASGRIINVAARPGLHGTARHSAYAAAKSAVIRLTETLAAELKDAGVQVNCILPGTIDTPQNRAAMPGADFSRWVPPQEIARVIQFLASDAASAVSGAVIPVFGRS